MLETNKHDLHNFECNDSSEIELGSATAGAP
jgi:hypothetical protein